MHIAYCAAVLLRSQRCLVIQNSVDFWKNKFPIYRLPILSRYKKNHIANCIGGFKIRRLMVIN